MATTTICDRCLRSDRRVKVPREEDSPWGRVNLVVSATGYRYDLCPGCLELFDGWIEPTPLTDTEDTG